MPLRKGRANGWYRIPKSDPGARGGGCYRMVATVPPSADHAASYASWISRASPVLSGSIVENDHAVAEAVGVDQLRLGNATVTRVIEWQVNALPVAVRARLPQLHVDIHAWSENPQARFVLINLQRYQEGDRLREGPVIRRILPDGVVLESDGLLFSLPRQ